ncbi:MAG: TetR family transcriptional regulator C-terminal domain-containing protein, partial [Anaerolineae bacterium]|nr:TetR family transcriptional regulator C-terminal domain-containing protein [Anaerolineae bacterium]
DDIAQVSGLGKGTLYLYYKTKDDLVVGLLEALFDDLLVQLKGLIDTDDVSVTARLTGYCTEMASAMAADASLLSIAYEFYAVAARRPVVRDYLQRYFADYRQALESLFTQGIASGEFPPFDVSQAAVMLVALLEGLTLLWFTDAGALSPEIMSRSVSRFLRMMSLEEGLNNE